MPKQITTIKISKDTVKALNQLKIHPRQSYEEVIIKLMKEKGEKK
jgi:predicted CopG family antitoxin